MGMGKKAAFLSAAIVTVVSTPIHAQSVAAISNDATETPKPSDTNEDIVVTAHNFLNSEDQSSTKLSLDLAKTPQSVSVIDSKLFDALGARSFLDAVEFVPGISYSGSAFGNPATFSRGYSTGGYKIDGTDAGTPRDIDQIAIQQLEFVKGGSGTTYGEGSAGGFINIILKKPANQFNLVSSAEVGSFDFYRGEASVTGPMNKAGTVRGYLAGSIENRHAFFDFEKTKTRSAYGVLAIDLTPSLTSTTTGFYSRTNTDHQNSGWPALARLDANGDLIGTVFPYALPLNQNVGQPWTFNRVRLLYARNETVFKASRGINLGLYVGYSRSQKDSLINDVTGLNGTGPLKPDGSGESYAYRFPNQSATLNLEARIFGSFSALGTANQYLLSAEYKRVRDASWSSDYTLLDDNYNIFNPRRDLPDLYGGLSRADYVAASSKDGRTIKSLSFTTITDVTNRLQLTTGGRFDEYKLTNSSYTGDFSNSSGISTNEDSFKSHNMSWRAAALYEIVPNGRIYYSYAETFTPNAARTCAGNVLPAETGQINEIGYKQQLFNKRLLLSASIYKIKTRGNVIFVDADPAVCPNPDGVAVLGNGTSSRGGDVELRGRLSRNWNIIAGYAYTRARTFDSGENLPTPGVAPHQISLFTLYDVDRGPLSGLGLGGGFTYLSALDATSGPSNYRMRFAGRFRGDLSVSYRFKQHFTVSLTVHNVLDAKDPTSPYSLVEYQNFWMEPRSALLTIESHF